MKPFFGALALCYFLPLFLPAQKPELVVPVGHTHAISSVAYSPDGKYCITGDQGGIAKIWTASGKEIQTIQADTNTLTSVAFSPSDGKLVLIGSGEMAKVWDWMTGKAVKTFESTTGSVEKAAFSRDGATILTSTKGGAQLWNRNSGKINHTLPLPNAELRSAIFSPDGNSILTLYLVTDPADDANKKAAAVLWDKASGKQIRSYDCDPDTYIATFADNKSILLGYNVVDVQTGAILRSFEGFGNGASGHVFSPNGQYLLTGHEEVNLRDGLRNCIATLWDAQSGKEIRTFSHKRSVTAVAFSPDGQYVLTGSKDETIKQWDPKIEEPICTFSGHGRPVSGVAYSPDGQAVLIGSGDAGKLWSLNEQKVINLPYDHDVTSVAFSPSDGGQFAFLGGGHYRAAIFDRTGKLVKRTGKSELEMLTANEGQFSGDERIGQLLVSPNGKYVLTAYTADWSAVLWDVQSGSRKASFGAGDAPVRSMAFSPDGQSVLTLSYGVAQLSTLTGKETQKFTLPEGQERDFETVAFSADGQPFLEGKVNGRTKRWSLDGQEINIKSDVARTNQSPDGKYRLEADKDNTAKIWDTATGAIVATLVNVDEDDWVVTAPSGLFDASPKAMELMYFKVGGEAIGLEQLKERYYEPGLLAKLTGFSTTELRDVVLFDKVALYPEIKAHIEQNQLKVALTERSGGLGKLSLFVNGKQVKDDINPGHLKTLAVDLDEFAALYRSDAPNTIGLVAYEADNWLKSEAFELPYQPVSGRGGAGDGPANAPKPNACGSVMPRLFLLVVGTSKYNDASKSLTYPDLDAAEMAKALGSTGKLLFGDRVQLKLLSTAGAGVDVSSKANIKAAFEEFAKKATPCDVLVAYFSGHGDTWGKVADKTNFYYLTKDITSAKLSDNTVREAYAISDADLTKWLSAIPAQKQVLILDACHSGKAAETFSGTGQRDLNASQAIALELLKDRTGTFILTGSAADMVSYEASKYGQGLLTYSLLQGISGTALKDGKYVDIMTLFQNSRDVVPKLAASIKQVQTPIIAAPKGGASFSIGIKDNTIHINLPQPKPVVIRSNFQDRDNFNDELGLTQAINDYYHDRTVKGTQAKTVYFDIAKFAEGYSIKGNYTINGETVTCNGKLFKGDTPVGDAFQVTGSKDSKALAKLITDEVDARIR